MFRDPLLASWLSAGLCLVVSPAPASDASPGKLTAECPELSAEELAEIEARFRSACLVRGAAMPSLQLDCSASRLELRDVSGSPTPWSQTRGSAKLVEQFLALLDQTLEEETRAELAPPGPGPVESHIEVPSQMEPIAIGVAPVIAEPTPLVASAPAGSTSEPLAPEDSMNERRAEESERTTPALKAQSRLSVGPTFELWATELVGAAGLEISERTLWGRWGFSVHGAAQISVDERESLRPFEIHGGAGAAFRPTRSIQLELGLLLSFLGVSPPAGTDGGLGSSLRPGAYAGITVEQPVSFGALYAKLGLRAVSASRAIYIGDELVETVPPVTPYVTVGAGFDL